MPKTSLADRADAVLAPVAARATRLGVLRAQGSHVWDENGRRLVDFTCGVGVTNLGHNHPEVLARAQRQLAELTHAGHNVSYYPAYVELAEALTDRMPGDYRAYFSNSGAEAIEGAVKLCVRATGRDVVLAFRRGFHGRTAVATALSSSNAAYRSGYGALMNTVQHLPFPYAFRSGRSEAAEVQMCLDAFDEHLALVTPAQDVAAVVVEPVLGEGGYLPAPKAFLAGLRDRCADGAIPLVLDEIQTGFGRTGTLFAYEQFDIEPDVLVLAKGIANGLPLSALLARADLTDRWPAGAHGGTYGGNPVACAAALGVLAVMDEELLRRAREVGDHLRSELARLVATYPGRVDVRGVGLMLGVEFVGPDGRPDAQVVADLRRVAEREGLLLLPCGPDRNVIRMIPPLTVSDHVVAGALRTFSAAVDEVIGQDADLAPELGVETRVHAGDR